MCMYPAHAGAHGGQKMALHPLVLQSQVIVSHHVEAVNWTQAPLQEQLLLAARQYLQPLGCTFILFYFFLLYLGE